MHTCLYVYMYVLPSLLPLLLCTVCIYLCIYVCMHVDSEITFHVLLSIVLYCIVRMYVFVLDILHVFKYMYCMLACIYMHTYIHHIQYIQYIHHIPAKLSNASLTVDHRDTHLPDVWQSQRSLLLLLRMYGRSLYIYTQFLAQERHTLLYLTSLEEHLHAYIHTYIHIRTNI